MMAPRFRRSVPALRRQLLETKTQLDHAEAAVATLRLQLADAAEAMYTEADGAVTWRQIGELLGVTHVAVLKMIERAKEVRAAGGLVPVDETVE